MKISILSICFALIFYSGGLQAQPNLSTKAKVDSLLQMLPKVNGIEKARVLASLSTSILYLNKDSSLLLTNQAIEQFKKANNEVDLFDFLVEQGVLISKNIDLYKGLNLLWKAQNIKNQELTTNVKRFLLFQKIGDAYFYSTSNDDSARYFYQKAESYVYDEASKGTILLSLGKINYILGLRFNALKMLFDAEKIFIKSKDKKNLITTYRYISTLFSDNGFYEKAFTYIEKSLSLSLELKSKQDIVDSLFGKIYVINRKSQCDSIFKIIDFAEEILSENSLDGIEVRKAYLRIYRGSCLLDIGKVDEALLTLKNAYNKIGKLNDENMKGALLMNLSKALLMNGKFNEAETRALESLEIIQKNKYWQVAPQLYGVLSQISAEKGNLKKALHFSDLRFQTYDSSFKSENRIKISLLEKDFELTRVEAEVKILEANKKLDKQRQYGLIIILVILALLLIVIFYFLYLTRKKNFSLNQANSIIQQQASEIINATNQKVTLFANISHELRTPVTLINGSLEQIKANPSYSRDNKLEIAIRNSRRLKSMVDEVFELTKNDQIKETSINLLEVELQPLLTRIVYSFDSLIEKKQLNLEFDATKIDGIIVGLNEEKFEKSINNLIQNAIKFTPPGGSIKISCEQHLSQDIVSIHIIDSGVGISEKDLPYVFDRFYQSSLNENKNEGLGIGLALVKEYIEQHKGSVSVSSSKAHGTTFTVQLPIVTDSIPHLEEALDENLPVVSFESFETQQSILLVEDNLEMQNYISEIFDKQVKFIFKSNGVEALEWLTNNTPDLIITDLMMPLMGGYELIESIKKSITLNSIPIVILTARADEKDKLYGISLGVDDYLTKPFNPLELKFRAFNLLMNSKTRSKSRNTLEIEEEKEYENEVSEKELLINKIEEFVNRHISLSDSSLSNLKLAQHLGMSERKFYNVCVRLIGLTPGQLIKEVKLKNAHEMLIKKEVTKVNELVTKLGFSDISYFSKQFYLRFGIRPTEILYGKS